MRDRWSRAGLVIVAITTLVGLLALSVAVTRRTAKHPTPTPATSPTPTASPTASGTPSPVIPVVLPTLPTSSRTVLVTPGPTVTVTRSPRPHATPRKSSTPSQSATPTAAPSPTCDVQHVLRCLMTRNLPKETRP